MITMFRDLQMLTRKGLEQPEAILNLALLFQQEIEHSGLLSS